MFHFRADVRVIVDDDAGLEEGILPALREYNIAQFTTVEVPGEQHQVSIIQLTASGCRYSIDLVLDNSQRFRARARHRRRTLS